MMLVRCLFALCIGIGQAASPPTTPGTPSTSARVAALQFALANGIAKFPGEVVVAVDSYFQAIDGYPLMLSMEEQQREAKEMAALLGPDVKVVSAAAYLTCASKYGNCVPSKNIAVVVVGGLYRDNSPGSYIRVYQPGSRKDDPGASAAFTHAVVDLERRGDSWVGVRFRLGPSTQIRR